MFNRVYNLVLLADCILPKVFSKKTNFISFFCMDNNLPHLNFRKIQYKLKYLFRKLQFFRNAIFIITILTNSREIDRQTRNRFPGSCCNYANFRVVNKKKVLNF